MKGLWKNKLNGYNRKDDKRKSQNKYQFYMDNSLHYVKNDKHEVLSNEVYLINSDRVPYGTRFGKLDDWNKARQFERNQADRRWRASVRSYVTKGNWEDDVRSPYGVRSVDYLV